MGGKKVDPYAGARVVERNSPNSILASLGILGSGSVNWDPKTKEVTNQVDFGQPLGQALDNSINRLGRYDQDAAARAQQAYDANYLPMQQAVGSQLGNMFAGMGQSGRRNSMGTNILAQYGSAQANEIARVINQLQQQARSEVMGENTNLLNQALAAAAPILRQTDGMQMGQMRSGTANQMGNMVQQAQMFNAQQAQQGMAGIGGLLGTLVGAPLAFGMGRM